jgi:hypothetical protein
MGEKPVSESSVVFFCENFVKCRWIAIMAANFSSSVSKD